MSKLKEMVIAWPYKGNSNDLIFGMELGTKYTMQLFYFGATFTISFHLDIWKYSDLHEQWIDIRKKNIAIRITEYRKILPNVE